MLFFLDVVAFFDRTTATISVVLTAILIFSVYVNLAVFLPILPCCVAEPKKLSFFFFLPPFIVKYNDLQMIETWMKGLP